MKIAKVAASIRTLPLPCIVFLATILRQVFPIETQYYLIPYSAFCLGYVYYFLSRQLLFVTFFILIAAFLLANVLQDPFIAAVIMVTLYVITAAFHFYSRDSAFRCYVKLLLIFVLTLMLTTYGSFFHTDSARLQVEGCAIALFIVLVMIVLQPKNSIVIRFKRGVEAVLTSLLGKSLQKPSDYPWQVEAILLQPTYPNFIFELGFNPGLRAGFRFFMVNLERLLDLYAILPTYYRGNGESIPAFDRVIEHNEVMIQLLKEYFLENKAPSTDLDFTADVADMEKVAQEMLPATVELLDLQPKYLNISAIVHILRDIREVLLKLLMALPAVQTQPLNQV